MNDQLLNLTGIVLREQTVKESDKIISVFTKEAGMVSIYVKGAMRLKNKYHSATSLFAYSEFVAFQSKGSELLQLNEANVKHTFVELSQNIEYLSLAMYMSELTREVSVPNDMNNEILRLFLNVIHMMVNKKWSLSLCKACFEMRLMCDTGFRPNLLGCKKCGVYETDIFYFDCENGEIVCTKCSKSYDRGYYIAEPATILALRYFAYADFEKLFTFTLSKEFEYQLCRICERYVLLHTKDNYKTLDFYKSLIQGDS